MRQYSFVGSSPLASFGVCHFCECGLFQRIASSMLLLVVLSASSVMQNVHFHDCICFVGLNAQLSGGRLHSFGEFGAFGAFGDFAGFFHSSDSGLSGLSGISGILLSGLSLVDGFGAFGDFVAFGAFAGFFHSFVGSSREFARSRPGFSIREKSLYFRCESWRIPTVRHTFVG